MAFRFADARRKVTLLMTFLPLPVYEDFPEKRMKRDQSSGRGYHTTFN